MRLASLLVLLASLVSCSPERPARGLDSTLATAYDSVWHRLGTGATPLEVVSITDSLIMLNSVLPQGEEVTQIIYGRGKALFKLGAYPEALFCMGRVIERTPKNIDLTQQALLFSGHALRACNDKLGALASYKSALRYSKPQEQARLADVSANIALVFSWLNIRDSAELYALRARPLFEAIGDTSGVAWTHRILAGTSENIIPHPRIIDSVLALPTIGTPRKMPAWETVLDATSDEFGMRWLATSTGLYRVVSNTVDQPVTGLLKTTACLRVQQTPSNELSVLTANNQWYSVNPTTFTVAHRTKPNINPTRIHLHNRHAYVPKRSIKWISSLPQGIDKSLVETIGPGPDSSKILYRRDLPPLQWWQTSGEWRALFQKDEFSVGLLPVSDLQNVSNVIYGAANYTGLVRSSFQGGPYGFVMNRNYRDGSLLQPGIIEQIDSCTALLHETDKTSILRDHAITRVPPKGIDATLALNTNPWVITAIAKDDTVTSTAIPVASTTFLVDIDSIQLSTTTVNEVDWFFVDVWIDGGQPQRLPEGGWLDLTGLANGEHIINISWSNGGSSSKIRVDINGGWYTSILGIITIIIFVAGCSGGFVWFISQRRARRMISQHRLLHEERERIARDLHDHVGNHLVRIGMLAQRIERASMEEARDALLHRMQSEAREATRSLRDVLTISQTDTSTLQEVIALLRERIRELSGDIDFKPEFDINSELDRVLTGEQRHNLVMFVMEAINNSARHGNISIIRFTLCKTVEGVELAIADNGAGKADDDRTGMGTTSMQHRAAVLGARLEWGTSLGGGTVVRLRWKTF